jgi:hypothetical protein
LTRNFYESKQKQLSGTGELTKNIWFRRNTIIFYITCRTVNEVLVRIQNKGPIPIYE